MARNLNQIVEEQLGGLMLRLLTKDVEIENLQEQITKLKEQQQLAKDKQPEDPAGKK